MPLRGSHDGHQLTPADVANRIGASEVSVRRWILEGKLEGVRLGNGPLARYRVTEEALQLFVRPCSRAVRPTMSGVVSTTDYWNDRRLKAELGPLGLVAVAALERQVADREFAIRQRRIDELKADTPTPEWVNGSGLAFANARRRPLA